VENLEMDDRFSLCNLVSDMGAKNAIVPPDEKTIAYASEHSKREMRIFQSDPEAVYEEEVALDVSGLEPLVSCPHSPDNVRTVSEIAGTKINVAYLGTCSNGRLSDIRAAAGLLKNRKVHPSVRLFVSPISQKVYHQALAEGLLGILIEAGATILPSSCSPCIGINLVILAKDDVAISTGPRNMSGRMGSSEAQIYTANPLVVASSSITGEITHPKDFLQ
jgi:homoaconitase/3-isopropylmalate dehydratase large subunit